MVFGNWQDALGRRKLPPVRTIAREPSRADATPNLLEIVWRRKLTVLVTLLVFLAGGILYILVTPPRYLASTSMLIDPRLGKTVGADPLTPGFMPDASTIDSQIKLFTSQTVLSRVAQMAKLKDVPEFNGSQRSLLQRLLHPGSDLNQDVDLRALEDAITIKRPERTYVVGIDVLASNPTLAAEIANDIPRAYIEDQISSRVDAARDDSSFVKDKLATLSNQLREAEEKVEAYKVEHNIIDTTGLRSNEQQVADLTKALGDARAKESDAKAALAEIDAMAKSGHLDAISEALRSPTIERLRQSQAETDQSVARLSMTLGPDHPELKEAQARAKEVKSLIRAELARLKLSAQQDYQVAHQHERQIASGVEKLKSQSADMNRAIVPLETLERNVRLLRASFDHFSKVDDSLAQQEGDTPPGRVISVARPPISPARPKKSLVGAIAFAAGLFFGLAAALFAESLSPPLEQDRFFEREEALDEPPQPEPVPRPRAEPRRTPPRARTTRRYWDDDDDLYA
ncbi:protein of unknown function [Beijerinckiaceae bacterium RH CH11]|nr:GumC family protein [Beijerinckiaceae bacterium]VVB44145.1 protein of unknown function [Beijerinckiaceae bacterium RH CH11]VVB44172.1 protein of unknown function [Beijerinckiaceae bacterium RH AL8]